MGILFRELACRLGVEMGMVCCDFPRWMDLMIFMVFAVIKTRFLYILYPQL